MDRMVIISSVLVAIGSSFMFFSILRAKRILGIVPEQLIKKWFFVICLMIFFLFGYIFFIYVLISQSRFPIEVITSAVFFGGAIYVYTVINISRTTISTIREKEMKILEAKDRLEIEVEKRTAQLREVNEQLRKELVDRRRAEERLKETAELLTRKNQELQEFVYIASHDLQEPLRKVMAFSDRLKSRYSDVIDEKGLDYMKRMQNATERMQTFINDLLMYSRVTTKARPYEPVDLKMVFNEVVNDLEVKIQESRGRVEAEGLAIIEADPLQMRQLFQNLIGNALKFRKKSEPPVVKIKGVFLEPEDNGSGRLYRITVQDNGIGFDERYADRIFGVFQRLHGRNEYRGSGIGLSICKKIVERHRGRIMARSSPGEGSTFIVLLPEKQVQDSGHVEVTGYSQDG
ncbi:MAG TPA: hypothetical protein ENK09_00025 [Nitrospirae bacterium]|nr:hypothetical protein [Nitrospirota bacterium]